MKPNVAPFNEEQDTKQAPQLPAPPVEALIQQGLFKGRTVTLFGEVTSEQCQSICGQILAMVEDDPQEPITLLIDSPGGNLMAGMMVYDLIKIIDAPVNTVAMGLAASMGQFLLSAGTKGRRWVFPSARIMMHQPSSGIGGSAEDIRIQVEQHRLTRKVFEQEQASNIGQSVETIHNDSERDRWFLAQDAVDYGIADHVLSSWSQLRVLKLEEKGKEHKS
ncbi:ClpP family protease [Corynebacterium belfantii]|nr:ATP-dependent Clp protease proteolytic subunit [Corynebacterium belfantii]SPJ42036.1 ATP-dependent Clp protease proteolytic subunit 2 [Corynebacterium diphtheriae subsp. lausannense]MBG9244948.1 ATP-dependent Clp protease proteolytic subunit [Corynebacterium belfantii]MBG9311409.1 ATP-dependent Clp protease proteolytic subunit [Corynebacterium belfantii]MBG9320468.1 ATP-dependent Clp protease proteolytic subunit [Corynebacterium belfantii]MBG9326718.1 ATP-dependent Clp protease proteolytic 